MAFHAQGSRIIIVVVLLIGSRIIIIMIVVLLVGAVKIYVAAVQVLRNKERQTR
jgi:ABC-type Na+ efflux pump permease subunit